MADRPLEDDAFILALTDDDPAELYENAPCGYLSTLPDGTIVKVNRTFLTWTGYGRDDIVGRRRFQELLRVGDRIFYETHLAPLLRLQGRVREVAVELVASGGIVLPVLVNSVVKTDQDGEPVVVRTAVFDARERRAYEEELVAARNRAEESEVRARALEALADEIRGKLVTAGLDDPEVTITVLDRLPRQDTGKLKRFIPLTPVAA